MIVTTGVPFVGRAVPYECFIVMRERTCDDRWVKNAGPELHNGGSHPTSHGRLDANQNGLIRTGFEPPLDLCHTTKRNFP